jgi:aspartyl-tRNA(Asn)/glutamyl-tRNA(Gln) amidotransferase subunit A
MARTVEDVAILLGEMAGHDPRDPFSRDKPVPAYTEALTGSVRGLKIGVPRTYFFEDLADEVDSASKKALKTFERIGAEVIEIDLPSATLQRGIWSQIASPEAYSYHEKYLQTRGEDYGADVRGRIEVGRLLLSIDYVRAQRGRRMMKEECKKIFELVDVIVTPTLPVTPPRIDEPMVRRGSAMEPVGVALTRLTRHFNLTGMPCISITCGFTAEGLPIGLQIAGRAFDESTVLRAAHAYEQETRWFERRPEM